MQCRRQIHIFLSMKKLAYYKITGYVLIRKLLKVGSIQESTETTRVETGMETHLLPVFYVIHYNDKHISIMHIHESSIGAFKVTAFH